MRYYQEVQLKNGKKCILRNPTYEDAQDILDHMKKTSGESNNLLRYPDEVHQTASAEGDFLKSIEESKDALMISAIIDGKLIANAGFNPISRLDKCKHRAEFGISIQKDYWGYGLGSLMLNAILENARDVGYTRMELDVVTDNERAIALYEKFGFRIFGTNVAAFCLRDGKTQAVHLMGCNLK